jgi:nucleoside-diphosphate-sugar epimerase
VSPQKRVLVTGATGFVGRWSVAPLLRSGFEVHATASGQTSLEAPAELHGAALHTVDLLNESSIDALLERVRPTHLLHFAWIATPGIYWQSPENSRWLSAGRHLLQSFHRLGGERAVMAGSCAEYDWSQVAVCDELSSPLASMSDPKLSAYAASKLAMHAALAEFSHRARLSSAWGRIFFQYGPYEHPDRLVPSVIRHLLEDQAALCTHGRQVRSFLHVADLGESFAELLKSAVEGPVNMGSDERVVLADLIGSIAREVGRPELVRLGARPAPAGEPAVLIPVVRRLRDEVGWRPSLSLHQGLVDTIDWWRAALGASRA